MIYQSIPITNWDNLIDTGDRSIIPLSNCHFNCNGDLKKIKINDSQMSTFLLYRISRILCVWSSHNMDHWSWFVPYLCHFSSVSPRQGACCIIYFFFIRYLTKLLFASVCSVQMCFEILAAKLWKICMYYLMSHTH